MIRATCFFLDYDLVSNEKIYQHIMYWVEDLTDMIEISPLFKNEININSYFSCLENNFYKNIYSAKTFEGIHIDAKKKYGFDLSNEEILSIMDLISYSSKIICDQEFIDKYPSKSDIYEEAPFHANEKWIVTYLLPNNIYKSLIQNNVPEY
jgi:hypothetical protein